MPHEITPLDEAQAKRAHEAICNEMNALGREGVSIAAILAGAGSAISDLITTQRNADAVEAWFRGNADLVKSLRE